MKLFILLLLFLVIISCALREDERIIVCQSFNELDNCIEKSNAEEIATCSNNVMENLILRLKEKVSDTTADDQAKVTFATQSIFHYGECISSIARAIQKINDKHREQELSIIKEEEFFTKECLTSTVNEGRNIFKCH